MDLCGRENVRSGKGREEMRKFWSDVNECLMEIGRENRIILIGDMNWSWE